MIAHYFCVCFIKGKLNEDDLYWVAASLRQQWDRSSQVGGTIVYLSCIQCLSEVEATGTKYM